MLFIEIGAALFLWVVGFAIIDYSATKVWWRIIWEGTAFLVIF